MPTRTPNAIDITTYQVGFGDCFLLKFHYPGGGRPHTVLIDFGSTHRAAFSMHDIAREIAKDAGGKLDVVVATHRHMDHVDGFRTTQSGHGSGKVIADLDPSAVILPWTEDPKADPKARRPTKKYGSHGPAMVGALQGMRGVAAAAVKQSQIHRFAEERDVAKQLKVLGENNLTNASAMANLRGMGRRTYYAYHGMKLALKRELPGVKVHVLGPPTLEQSDTIKKQRSKDADEFWHLQAQASLGAIEDPLAFPGVKESRNPVWARWLRRKMRVSRAEQLLSIVRALDHAMNNTSLILVFEVGGRKLLFPGDAQYENWMYALDKPWVRRLLEDVDVYKVGHHGSLNATPISMYEGFKKRVKPGRAPKMDTLLSTMPGVHGSEKRKTEVPRKRLVNRLDDETELTSTSDFDPDQISFTLTLEL